MKHLAHTILTGPRSIEAGGKRHARLLDSLRGATAMAAVDT